MSVGRKKVVAAAGDFAEVDPFDVGVVVGDGAVGERGREVFDVARLVDVFEFVRQAVEVADDLGEHAAADFVFEDVGGDFDEARRLVARSRERQGRRCKTSAQRVRSSFCIATDYGG